jgi:predicted TIM-barrel fold metal-dependent hydrolase
MKRRQFLDLGLDALLAGAIWPRGVLPGGRPSPEGPPFLDAHAHTLSPALLAYRERGPNRKGASPVDGAELVRRMDADGIRRAFVLSTAYQMAADVNRREPVDADEYARVRQENDFAAEQCARFPDRLVPFLSVNPKRSWAVEEIDRCVEQRHMRGLKLHFWNSLVDTRQPDQLEQLRRVVAHAADRGLPVVAHIFIGAVEGYGPDDTERFVKAVIEPATSLRISIAHLAGAGGFAEPAQRCFERLARLCGPGTPLAARVWMDMSATLLDTTTPADLARLGELLPRWGTDRLLWGSDNMANALALTRAKWPLADADWSAIRSHRGEELCPTVAG